MAQSRREIEVQPRVKRNRAIEKSYITEALVIRYNMDSEDARLVGLELDKQIGEHIIAGDDIAFLKRLPEGKSRLTVLSTLPIKKHREE
jgi:hypothetical protein